MRFFMVMPAGSNCFADEKGCQYGKDVCLKGTHQQFEQVNENGEGNGEDRSSEACKNAHSGKDEYEHEERKHNQVPGQHIREQPDH